MQRDADIPRLMTTASGMLARGDADGALEMLRRVLAASPGDVAALRLTGLVLAERGQHARARGFLERAVAAAPGDADVVYELGNLCLDLGEHARAAALLARAVATRPEHVEARNNLGNALLAQGHPAAALAEYAAALALRPEGPVIRRNIAAVLGANPGALREAVARTARALLIGGANGAVETFCAMARDADPADPEPFYIPGVRRAAAADWAAAEDFLRAAVARGPMHAAAWGELGGVLLAREKSAEALECCERAVAIDPLATAALINRAEALARLGRLAEAVAACDAALAVAPDSVLALNNRGNLLARTGRTVAALADFERAVTLDPARAETHFNHGNMLQVLGRDAEAVASFGRAIALAPGHARALNNRGVARRRLGERAEAVADYRQAAAADPNFAHAWANCAIELEETGDVAAARAGYARAVALDPDLFAARRGQMSTTLPLVRQHGDDLDASRRAFADALERFLAWADGAGKGVDAVGESYPFIVAYHDRNNRDLLGRLGTLGCAAMRRWLEGEGLAADLPPPPEAGAPIRIGIVMSQFWNHSVWLAIVKGWVAHMDRRRFELHLFHTGPDDDVETGWARAHAASFIQAGRDGPAGLAGWVRAIRARRPDVLIYPEFGMDHVTMRLASLRLARVQAASWGHPETTGLPSIDHYISAEAFEGPGAAAHYTERLLRLPRLGCSYARLPVAPAAVDLAALGVDPARPVLMCPGTPFKYQPEGDALFTRLARLLPDCQFLFFTFKGGPELSRLVMERLAGRFAAEGLDFARHVRLLGWQSRPAFYGLFRRADAMLDTVGFSGFNTVMQALECGLPVVTMEGRFLRGRLGSGILRVMGLDELVATDMDGYLAIAARLVADPAFNAAARARIGERREALFDDVATVRALEDFLEAELRQPG